MIKQNSFSHVEEINTFEYVDSDGRYELVQTCVYREDGVRETIRVWKKSAIDSPVTDYFQIKKVVDAYYDYLKE